MGIMRAKKFLLTTLGVIFILNQLEKDKNPGKNFFALNNTHNNGINRYLKIIFLIVMFLKSEG